MKKILAFYSEHVWIQVLAAAIPYTAYVIAWFAGSLPFLVLSFYGICITVTAILAVAIGHRIAKNGKKARLSLDAFCILFLLAFFTVLILSPLSFRREL
jgi:prolipoprotein diacylglyceryltransferase